MKIAKDAVVAIDYTLKDDDGKQLDASRGNPLFYLHGHDNIVAGLEEALEGKGAGDVVDVIVPPEQGYGSRDEKLVLEVDKGELPQNFNPTRGAHLGMTVGGKQRQATITKVKLKTVVLDANHPLADVALHFSVTVREVRKATKEELQHGHAHGPGGHHH